MDKINKVFRNYHILIIALVFVVACILFTYPAILHLSDKLIGDGGDNYQYFGFQYITSQQIKNFRYPFAWTDILRYPVGFNFGIGYDSALNALIGSFFALFVSNVTAFNLTVLTLLFLNGFLSYLFFQYLTKDVFLGLIGAFIYGFSSYVLARTAGHINLMFIGSLPFLCYNILKLSKPNVKNRDIFFFYTSMLLVFLGSFQYSLLIVIATVCIAPVIYLFYKKELFEFFRAILPRWKSFLYIGAPFFLIFFVIAFPFLQALLTQTIEFLDRTSLIGQFSPTLTDFIVPNHFSRLLFGNLTRSLSSSLKSIERVVFVGWVELAVFFGFAFSRYPKKIKGFLLISSVLFFLLSLGNSFEIFGVTIPLPYALLYNKFPFSYIPEPGRFFIFFYLILTVSVLFCLRYFASKKTPMAYGFFTILLFFIVFERLPHRFWLSPTFEDKPYMTAVKQSKGEAVLDIPVENYFNTTTYAMFPYSYNKKILSGYFHYLADTKTSKSFLENPLIERFICNPEKISSSMNPQLEQLQTGLNSLLLQTLKDNQIYTIVVHKNDPEDHAKYYFPECSNARIQSSILLPQLFYPDATDIQKVLSLFFPALGEYGNTVTIPYDGIFYIDGFHAYPNTWLPIHVFIDGNEVIFPQYWTDRGSRNVTLDPFLKLEVKKGARITFSFDRNQNTDYSFIKLWYRYSPTQKDQEPLIINGVRKVYEDEDAAVFQIE